MAGSEAQVTSLEIRQLYDLDDFEAIFEVQKAIWGYSDGDLVPVRFFAVVVKVGGHVFGAFDGPRLAGFCFAIPGFKPDGSRYLHSHMLGVLPEYRNFHIGRSLKLRQRDDALARGIPLIEWTFDPLEIKNAFFNIEKLGAIIRVYKENQYGTTTSPLHGGLPTDRCTAEWWLDSPRVRAILSGAGRTAKTGQEACPTERIVYPADIARIRAEDPPTARSIQFTNAHLFQDAFSRSLAVTGFSRGDTEGAYLLEPWS